MRKKILLIGMLNSTHMGNWLERISQLDADIYLFPSRRYRELNPKIKSIIENNSSINTIKVHSNQKISVYAEFLLDLAWMKYLKHFSRSGRLKRLLREQNFDKIHAIELQHAGYLLSESLPGEKKFTNIIMTNWGSDIYYYAQFSDHAKRIRNCLQVANFYSAECSRDYELAREYGFNGTDLPIVPNSTTFPQSFFKDEILPSRKRNQIIMKCYGATFGLGEILLEIAETALERHRRIHIYAYSVTPDLRLSAEMLHRKHPTRFKYSTVKEPVPHKRIIQEFRKSRVYIGASRSDGVSTSFLEAIATGAYPIQTSTSCAVEWIQSGAKGAIVEPYLGEIEKNLEGVLMDIATLEEAQMVNSAIAKTRLSFETISEITKGFYS